MRPCVCPLPECGQHNGPSADRCSRCGADLRPLQALDRAVDRAFNRGVAAVRREDWQAAVVAFDTALALRPDDLTARKAAAACRSHLGNVTDSLRRWRDVLDDHPDDEQAQRIIATLDAAIAPDPQARSDILLLLEMPPIEPDHPQ